LISGYVVKGIGQLESLFGMPVDKIAFLIADISDDRELRFYPGARRGLVLGYRAPTR
jgi:hypothetical protein